MANWLEILKTHLKDIKGPGWTDENLVTINTAIVAIQAVTDVLPNDGALSDLALEATLTAIKGDGWTDETLKAIKDAIDNTALEASLTAIKGDGWTNETLKAIKDAIDALGGSNSYQEKGIIDFDLTAIDTTLTAPPPTADTENSVVDIDVVADHVKVLRSFWVNVTSFGSGTKLIFKLWIVLNTAVTMVDSVDITDLGIQSLMDIFGLSEVHSTGIWVTVQTDSGTTGACAGSYAKADATYV